VIYKLKRYVGNVNTLELHDTDNEQTSCRLDDVSMEARCWFDSIAEAGRDRPYDNCRWCLGGSITRTPASDQSATGTHTQGSVNIP
jgi:hypothetical protein